MRFKLFKYKTVTSTNDVAINLIKFKKEKKGFIHANQQTKGRGTRGKKWISKSGNLFVSIFFPLKKDYPPFNEFSAINPVLLSYVIKNFCKSKDISFKWPNDIFLNGRKICGILQELITFKKKDFLIIGIGLNVVSSPSINRNYKATNILLETKRKPSIKKIAKLIINSYEKFFKNLKSYNYNNYKNKLV